MTQVAFMFVAIITFPLLGFVIRHLFYYSWVSVGWAEIMTRMGCGLSLWTGLTWTGLDTH